ncbi:hypothetical protein BDR04DRAFT_1123520 [Suillus decipiens]|nr:hypothetical protein BDR04DRAFT_1123520 [Suillus decipiens]
MPEEAPPELPHLLFHNSLLGGHAVTNWYKWMVDGHNGPDNHYLMCSLDRIDYCKCIDGAKHEFLLFYFRHWTGSSAEAVVCAERTVERGNGSRQSSDIISSSSKETAATDQAFLLGSPDGAIQYLRNKYAPYRKLCTLTFLPPSAPSALHVAAILCLVHEQAPAYTLYEKQCYWYADSVWMSLKRIFPQNEELCRDHNARNHYYGIGGLGRSSATVEAVCAAYLSEWQNTMDKLMQVKQRLEARVVQSRQEGRQEGLREGRREGRQEGFAEAKRAADEQIRQLQAEIEQLRAGFAVSESRTTAI